MSQPDSGERTGIPRWVRLSVLGALVVAAVAVAVLLMSGGHTRPTHGPAGDDAPPASER